MILLLTFRNYEQCTDPVINWLLHNKADFIRVSIYDIVYNQSDYELNVTEGEFLYQGEDIKDKINVIWFRRFLSDFIIDEENVAPHIQRQLTNELKNHLKTVFDFFCDLFSDKIWLPHPEAFKISKIQSLHIAKKLGISVPDTIITNNKSTLLDFFEKCKFGIITKPIDDEFRSYYLHKGRGFFSYTKSLTLDQIKNLEHYFFPTLFQQKIDKELEIRSFYLDGDFYHTALIDSKNEHENDIIDIKKIQKSKHTHRVKYRLPAKVEDELRRLMEAMNMNTGSLDIIKYKDGTYYFLEVNIVGQFATQSLHCNYYLERRVADWLTTKDNACKEKNQRTSLMSA